MKTSPGKLVGASLAAVVLASFLVAPIAEAARGGGGGGAGARGGGGGGGAAARGGGGQTSRADARTNDVRSTSVNNVSAERNVNVNVDCSGRCGGWDHPVAATAVVVGTAAAVGAAVATPPSCYVEGLLVSPCPY